MLCVGVVGSAVAGSSAAAKPSLRVGTTFSYDQFWADPGLYASYGREGSFQQSFQFASLFHMKPAGAIAPALATSWRTFVVGKSGPNKNFEFTLRKDAKFADGLPVNAAAVVGWLKWYNTTNTFYGQGLGPKPVFEAVGQWKVRVKLTFPTPNFFELLSDVGPNWGWVASPRCVADRTQFAQGRCGAGPFMLDPANSVKGDHYLYVPNPNYYDKKNVKWSKIEHRVIGVSTSLLQALQAGQLDLAAAGNDPSTAQAAVSGGAKLYWASTTFLFLNLHSKGTPTNSPFYDLKVRQALSYALDRKAIAAALGFGFSKPLGAWRATDAFDPKSADDYAYDEAKAKSLLAQAGLANGVSFKVFTYNNDMLRAMTAISKYLAAVKINVDITPAPTAQAISLNATSPAQITQTTVEPTPSTYTRIFSPTTGSRYMDADAQTSKLFYAGLKAKDPTANYKAMWAHISDQAYVVPICTLPLLFYANPNLSGINVSARRGGAMNVMELFPKT